MKAKYKNLTQALLSSNQEVVKYTFEEIETIIEGSIPNTYIKARRISRSSRIGKYAEQAGYWIAFVDYLNRIITFMRGEEIVIPEAIEYNSDLPSSITKTNGVVDITASNARIINETVGNHLAYSHTYGAFSKLFRETRPANPEQIDKDTIVLRLILIDEMDGTNLRTGFGTGSFSIIADSILENHIEELIAVGKPIPDRIFRAIALRQSTKDDNPKSFFSVISKYIARTAQYAYGILNGYPIYDGVLSEHLYLYIPYLSKERIKVIAKECFYQEYCQKINKYLELINRGIETTSRNYVTNIMFDQIVWFSYKDANAEQKWR